MSVRKGFLVLLAFFLFVFSITFIVYSRFSARRVQDFYRSEINERKSVFDRITDLRAASLKTLVSDYTFWDEMVNFVQSRDPVWAADNLGNSTMNLFDADGIWVYGLEDLPVYSSTRSSMEGEAHLSLPPEKIKALFEHSHFAHFFMPSPQGVIEVRGATIHPTSDPDRTTPPRGYFFAAKLWGPEYLRELENLTETSIEISEISGRIETRNAPAPAAQSKLFIEPLTGWDGLPAASLRVRVYAPQIGEMEHLRAAFSGLFILFVVCIFFLAAVFITFLVDRPLRLISGVLRENDRSSLRKLSRYKTEFGDIARLMGEFFRQKEELQQSESRFRQLLADINDIVYRVSPTGTIQYVSPQVQSLYGYGEDDLIGENITATTPPAEVPKIMEAIGMVLAGKSLQHLEIVQKDARGRLIPMEVNASPMFRNGAVVAVQGVMRDMSEKKKTQDALRVSEAKYRRLVENLGSSFFFYSRSTDGIFSYISPTVEQMLGYSPEEFQAHYREYMTGNPVNKQAVVFAGQFLPGAAQPPFQVEICARDGMRKWLEITEAPLWGDGGTVTAVEGIAQDITARRDASQRLQEYTATIEEINKELDDFSYIVSHDLKEPLRSIDAFSKFMVHDYGEGLAPDARTYLERIRANSIRMQQLIDDLLKLSRIGRKPNMFEEIDLNEVIKDVCFRLEYSITEKKAQIAVTQRLPLIIGDRVRLAEVFVNLISNGIKFTDNRQPYIEIGYAEKDGEYEFFVKDNGPGIEGRYFSKIFDIFQRLGRKEEHEGTGAGLAIVKKIVQMHGGLVRIESEVGVGSTFFFTIPKLELMNSRDVEKHGVVAGQ